MQKSRTGCRKVRQPVLLLYSIYHLFGIYTRDCCPYDFGSCKWRHQKNVFTNEVFIKCYVICCFCGKCMYYFL